MKRFITAIVVFFGTLNGEIDKLLAKKYLPENPVVIDAGAHNGRSSLEITELWPQATIYAFEPVPDLFDQLVMNTRDHSNIICSTYAFGDKIGTQQLFISKGRGDGSSSLLKPAEHLIHFPDVTFDRSIEINVTTIDAWAHEKNITHIDLLWLDMQGVEYQVLKASPIILKTVRAIFTEINMVPLYQNCTLYPILKAFLESQGFVEIHKEMLHHTFGDALFVRKDLLR